MHLGVFEDRQVLDLEPLTLTRTAFDLVCGASTLLTRQRRFLDMPETSLLVRPGLAELTRLHHPELAVNDAPALARQVTMLVNARWLPPVEALTEATSPRVGLLGGEVAYVILPQPGLPDMPSDAINDWVDSWKPTLPHAEAGGVWMRYPWDLVGYNAQALCDELHWWPVSAPAHAAPALQVVGPPERLRVDPTAHVDPFVVADTRNGPVFIDRDAQVHSFSRLEGPCYVGPESWILGAKLRGGTIGPQCRVGGEFEASILLAHSNKYHDGFLGHSYAGEWVNLAAGTQVSDLRNDYGKIHCVINGQRTATGLTKVGAFFGDHTKTGLNTLINTGSVIGAFSNLLPSGSYLPSSVPSFCTVAQGQLQERSDLRQLFTTADAVMRRRGAELTNVHEDFIFALFEQTAGRRRRAIRDNEQRRLRHSI